MTKPMETHISDCYLRFATKKDVPIILEFINRLAEYEKLVHEVVASEQLIEKFLFGDQTYGEVVLAFYEDSPAGFALFYHNFSTFLGRPGIYLEDLFVKPEYRGKGIGKMLLSFLAKLTVDRDCGRLEWSVLDWNTLAINFYRALKSVSMDDWTTFRLTGDSLQELSKQFDLR